ncbi:MAG: hypothetical protein CMB82_12020 [Flammeovirgaceae bacterium]|nr:hypothetical protein [Flammeovirgaceae bacterium]|tara:strand:+ start:247 stop:1164 length:918 start_codon:yes stop_codon:yes gene_type:complete
MNIQDSDFTYLDLWAISMQWLIVAFLAISILSIVIYWIIYSTKKSMKAKHEIASESEIKVLRFSQIMIALAIFCLVNILQEEIVERAPMPWFAIRAFMGICFGTLYGYIAHLIFTYYYPGQISARLEKLRYTPRINPTTGNKMKLLSEEEEDAYLDEGQQAEENVFSVDYDVWIDEETGYTHIEKYKGHLNAHECDNCGFRTLRLVQEEVVEEATEYWDGSVNQEFSCSYCGRVKRKTVALSYKVKDDVSETARLVSNPLANNKEVETVKIEIFSNKGDSKVFNFQNIEQTQSFLEEFDYEKMDD